MTKTPQCTCPKAQSLFTLLGKKWVIFILQAIDDGHHSFKTIGEAIGDANTKILTDRLEEITVSGIIERRIGGDTPGAIRYYLSPLGKKLSERLIDLSRWWGEEGLHGYRNPLKDKEYFSCNPPSPSLLREGIEQDSHEEQNFPKGKSAKIDSHE